MALGFSYGNGNGEIVPFIKYDARAGKIFRNDRVEVNGNYANNAVDITSSFKAVIDMENIEVGWMLLAAGAAPAYAFQKAGGPIPPAPADGREWKQALRVMMKLHSSCGGDIRELSGSAAAFRHGFEDLHNQYEAEKDRNSGLLPIVTVHETKPVTTGSGKNKSTNYEPVFNIVGWSARPADLVHVPKNGYDPT